MPLERSSASMVQAWSVIVLKASPLALFETCVSPMGANQSASLETFTHPGTMRCLEMLTCYILRPLGA